MGESACKLTDSPGELTHIIPHATFVGRKRHPVFLLPPIMHPIPKSYISTLWSGCAGAGGGVRGAAQKKAKGASF